MTALLIVLLSAACFLFGYGMCYLARLDGENAAFDEGFKAGVRMERKYGKPGPPTQWNAEAARSAPIERESGIEANGGAMAMVGDVRTFRGVETSKAQALKVLEEAAEVFGAWQIMDTWDNSGGYSERIREEVHAVNRSKLLDECADVIQATCNLVASLGVDDFTPYMQECERRNRERGRM